MIQPHAATVALAADLTTRAPAALVTLHADKATPALLAGKTVIVISAPRMSIDAVAVSYTWTLAVIGAPVANLDAAGHALDATLSAISALDGLTLDSAEPITWSGTQTSQAPAYLLTASRTYTRT